MYPKIVAFMKKATISFLLALVVSIVSSAQPPEKTDSLLLHKVLNVEFGFDGIDGQGAFQTLSVSVCDAGVVERDTVNANAVADLLLCSEIRGQIEKPNHYFEEPTPKVDAELDLLMLTQGWRRYDIDSIMNRRYPTIQYDIEESQSISGRVERTLNKHPKNMKLMLLSPMTGVMESFDLGDNNRFRITDLDFIDGTPFTVQATTPKGHSRFVQIKVEEEVFPDIHTKRKVANNGRPATSSLIDFYNKSKLYDEVKDKTIYKELQLNEVEVRGLKPTWYNPFGIKPTKMLEEGDYFLDHASYSGAVIQRLGLILKGAQGFNGEDVVGEKFGKYHPNKYGKMVLVPPILYIDGFKAEQDELLRMPPENISRIEFYGSGSFLNVEDKLEGDAFGENDYLFVFTKQTARIHNKASSMESVKPLGYKQSCEFYQPPYESRIQTVPDYRTTYYWNPSLQASPEGKWSFKCLIPCTTKKVLLTVEGVGEDGRVVSETKIITI